MLFACKTGRLIDKLQNTADKVRFSADKQAKNDLKINNLPFIVNKAVFVYKCCATVYFVLQGAK
jgi:hypothetical protein